MLTEKMTKKSYYFVIFFCSFLQVTTRTKPIGGSSLLSECISSELQTDKNIPDFEHPILLCTFDDVHGFREAIWQKEI